MARNIMRNKILFCLMLGIFLIGLASAQVQFFQYEIDMGNGTIKNHLVAFYEKEGGESADYVSGGNPFEVNLMYNFYPNTWNFNNPNYTVERCDWQVYFWGNLANSSTLVVNESFYPIDLDVNNAHYFMKLHDGDGITADQICYFNDTNFSYLDIPATMQLIFPSWECKACQYYEWSVQERSIVQAKNIGGKIVDISGYIKNLFFLNFEIWLVLFWIFLISMVLVAIGMIFTGVYWFWIYLKRLVK